MCDRTKDGDCRVVDTGIVLCHTELNGVDPGQHHPERPFVYCGYSDEAQGFGIWKPEHLCDDKPQKEQRQPQTRYFDYFFWDGTPTPARRYRKDFGDGRPKEVKWCRGGLQGRPQTDVAPYLWHEMSARAADGEMLFIAKGELKVEQLKAAGFPSISILGISGQLVSNLRGFGAQVILAPDCDREDLNGWYRELINQLPDARTLLPTLKGMNWRTPPANGGLGVEDWLQRSKPDPEAIQAAITASPWKPISGISEDSTADEESVPLNERIDAFVQELLDAHLANNAGEIDAAFAELYRLGVKRDRCEERILMLWAESHGLDISTGAKPQPNLRGRIVGQAKSGQGMRQQLPGFGIDKDLHLVVSDAAVGKTTALAELVTVMSARDKGFLDHEAPRSDPADDQRNVALVIASDGEASAYSMWESYLESIGSTDRGATVEIWAQDDETNETAWNVSLHNLERLINRLAVGDVCVVVMDTANAIFRGAGVNTGVGPIETYLRLLKQIVCKTAPLWISQHTNRNSGTTMKAIGGHPAFQEVPSVIHLIEAKEQADGTKLRVWHVLKLRGAGYRRFSYELAAGELKVTEGHFFQNCKEQILVLLHKQILGGGFTSAGDLIRASNRPAQSVYGALGELKSERLIRPKGSGYRITAAGQRRLDTLTVQSTEKPEWAA